MYNNLFGLLNCVCRHIPCVHNKRCRTAKSPLDQLWPNINGAACLVHIQPTLETTLASRNPVTYVNYTILRNNMVWYTTWCCAGWEYPEYANTEWLHIQPHLEASSVCQKLVRLKIYISLNLKQNKDQYYFLIFYLLLVDLIQRNETNKFDKNWSNDRPPGWSFNI